MFEIYDRRLDIGNGVPGWISPTALAPIPPPVYNTLFGFYAGQQVLGGSISTSASYNIVKGYLGGPTNTPQVYRIFYNDTSSLDIGNGFPGSFCDYGPPVIASFKFSPQSVIAGTHDAKITAWFNSIPVNRRVWWSFYHEPEENIEAGTFTATQYRDAWSHILDLAPVRDTLRGVVILMNYSNYKTSRKDNIAQYITTNSKLHGLFWDSYLTGNTKTISGLVDLPKSVSNNFNLKFGICEVSVAVGFNMTGMTHIQTVNTIVPQLITRARQAEAEVVTWFESNKSDGNWLMRDYATAVASWNSGAYN